MMITFLFLSCSIYCIQFQIIKTTFVEHPIKLLLINVKHYNFNFFFFYDKYIKTTPEICLNDTVLITF